MEVLDPRPPVPPTSPTPPLGLPLKVLNNDEDESSKPPPSSSSPTGASQQQSSVESPTNREMDSTSLSKLNQSSSSSSLPNHSSPIPSSPPRHSPASNISSQTDKSNQPTSGDHPAQMGRTDPCSGDHLESNVPTSAGGETCESTNGNNIGGTNSSNQDSQNENLSPGIGESSSYSLNAASHDHKDQNTPSAQPYDQSSYKDNSGLSHSAKDFYQERDQDSCLIGSSMPQGTGYPVHDGGGGQRFPFDPSDPRNYHQNSPSEMSVNPYSNSMHQDSPSRVNPSDLVSSASSLLSNLHHRNSPYMHRSSPHLPSETSQQHLQGSPHLSHQDSPGFSHHHQNSSQQFSLNPLGYSSVGRSSIDSPHGHGSPHRKDSSIGGDGSRFSGTDFHSPHHRPPHHPHLSPSPHRPPYSDHQMKDSPHHSMQDSDYHHPGSSSSTAHRSVAPDSYWNMHLDAMSSKIKNEGTNPGSVGSNAPSTKDSWYDTTDSSMLSDRASGIKSEPDPFQGYSNSMPPHHSMGDAHDSSPINPQQHMGTPHGYSPQQGQQSSGSDQQSMSHYSNYQGMGGNMSPMSPGYQTSQRNPGGYHNGQYQSDPSQQYGQLGLQQGPQYPGQGCHMGGPGGLGPHGGGGREGDPYSFVDEYTGPSPRPVDEVLGNQQPKRRGRKPKHIKLMENGGDPLVIAAAQAAHEAKKRKMKTNIGPDGKIMPTIIKPRKKMDRFDGLPEDEITKRVLPDHLGPNLDIVIISKFPFQIGINPGLFAAYKGHHYAGPGNHFWKCLFLSGLIPEPLTCDDDHQLLHHGIGFTNIVARTTRGSAELTRKEIKEGGQHLLAKLQQYQPRIAVFNGKGIYEIFSGKKEFSFGRQPEKIEGTHTHVWVMPSSSARCAQLPRALDKVPFYTALRKFRDFLKGTLDELKEEDIAFANIKIRNLKKDPEKMAALAGDSLLKGESMLEDFMGNDLLRPRDLLEGEIRKEMTGGDGITSQELGMDIDPIRRDLMSSAASGGEDSLRRDILGGDDSRRDMFGNTDSTMSSMLSDDAMKIEMNDFAKDELEEDEEVSKITPQSLFKLNGMSREQLESLDCPTIPIRKKRGRPKKTPDDPNMPERPRPRSLSQQQQQQMGGVGPPGSIGPPGAMICNGLSPPMVDDLPRKKRGRPKKLLPDGTVPPPKRPGRKPKALKEMLQQQPPVPHMGHMGGIPMHDSSPHHMALNHMNGIMSPQGFSPNHSNQTFSPQYGGGNQPSVMGQGMHNPQQYMHPQMGGMHQGSGLGPGHPGAMGHNGPLTPGSTNPGMHPAMHHNPHTPGSQTPGGGRGPTPHQFGQSPGYSPSPVTPGHHLPPHYQGGLMSQPGDGHKQDMSSMEDEQQLGLSPPPASPVMAQPDFEPPNTINENDPQSIPPVEQRPTPLTPNHPSPATSHMDTNTQPMHSNPSTPVETNHQSAPSYPPYQSSYQTGPSHHSPSKHVPSPSMGGLASVMGKGDVASKSLSGLESLVDQIPSISGDHHESNSQHSTHSSTHSNAHSNTCSNPTTPAPPPPPHPQQTHPPFSPGPPPSYGNSSSSYSSQAAAAPPQAPASHYNSPQHPYSPHYSSPQQQTSYSPHYSSSSTNLSSTNNFSVSSLANSSLTTSLSYSQSSTPATSPSTTPSTSSFSVSSLTGGSPTPAPSLYSSSSSYSPAPPAGGAPLSHSSYSDIMGSPMLAPTPPMGSAFMSSPGLMSSPGPMSGSGSMGAMGPLHSSMSQAASQIPYSYSQYGDSGSSHYPTPGAHSSFPHYPGSAPPGFHVPSPRFPYPHPTYGNSPYSQGYSQNSVLERIKHSGMSMGFGGF